MCQMGLQKKVFFKTRVFFWGGGCEQKMCNLKVYLNVDAQDRRAHSLNQQGTIWKNWHFYRLIQL